MRISWPARIDAGAGRDTLLIAPTGGGKTLAGFLPSLDRSRAARQQAPSRRRGHPHALYLAAQGAGRRHRAQSRGAGRGDGAADHGSRPAPATRRRRTRARQRTRPPDILLTTPEQLALLLAAPRRGRPVRRAQMRRARRAACAGHLQARRSAGARPGAAANAGARAHDHRPVGDGGRPDELRAWLVPQPGAERDRGWPSSCVARRAPSRDIAILELDEPICPGPATRRATRIREIYAAIRRTA